MEDKKEMLNVNESLNNLNVTIAMAKAIGVRSAGSKEVLQELKEDIMKAQDRFVISCERLFYQGED